jgi:adenylate kinase
MSGEIRIVLIGAPGSGKGTQAERFAGRLGIPWISTGELLRKAVADGSDLGRRVAEILTTGSLVDDDTMADVVKARLRQDDAQKGFILDGYPRTQGQADTLAHILEDLHEPLTRVLFIDVGEDELVRRALARAREDDTEKVIRKRIEVYREKTEPLIRYYEGFGLLQRINGARTIDEVSEEIAASLAARV